MSAIVPRYAADLKVVLPAFKAWLTQRGAAVLDTTNEWEVLRFKGQQTAVIYMDKSGRLSFTGGSKLALDAFKRNATWQGSPATPKPKKKPKGKRHMYSTIRRRDGNTCFFCLDDVSEEDESIEHLVSRVNGGPDHLANFALAHRICNSRAGHLSAMEKIAIHVAAQMKRAQGGAA